MPSFMLKTFHMGIWVPQRENAYLGKCFFPDSVMSMAQLVASTHRETEAGWEVTESNHVMIAAPELKK